MRKFLIGIGTVLVVLLLAVAGLSFLIDANQFRPKLEAELSAALGRVVTVGNLHFNLFGGSVIADALSVADDQKFRHSALFARALFLKLTVELWPLIVSRKLRVQGLLIDQPEIALIQAPQGGWNFSGIGAGKPSTAAPAAGAPSALDLSVQLIQVSGGRIALSRLGGPIKPQAVEGVDAEIRNFAPSASFPFSMTGKLASGGEIHLDGKAGPLNSTDAAATPVAVTLKVSNMQMAASGLIDKTSGIDGQLSIDGTGTSDGTDLRWTGSVHIEKLKLSNGGAPAARPVEMDVALDHNVRSHFRKCKPAVTCTSARRSGT